MSKPTQKLASSASSPPTTSSYWAVPRSLLAGAYPGEPDPVEHHEKVQLLVGAGIRAAAPPRLWQGRRKHPGRVPFRHPRCLATRLA